MKKCDSLIACQEDANHVDSLHFTQIFLQKFCTHQTPTFPLSTMVIFITKRN